MNQDSNFDLITRKVEKWTVVLSLAVLSWTYLGRSQLPKVEVEDSLKGKASPTLNNLQKAYNSEANSHLTYSNFAKKARNEGHKDVALLFKTLANAEKVHQDNNAQVIKAMGATPKRTMAISQAPTTNNLSKLVKDNLSSSVNGESDEYQMYSQFIKQAKLDNNSAALKTFQTSLVAENKHSQILAQVEGNLDDWELDNHEFYVCQLTGETFDGHPGVGTCSL
jgi:rubrerythrin